jgi:hypothetical protein
MSEQDFMPRESIDETKPWVETWKRATPVKTMNALFQVAADVQTVCRGQCWKFCFIGWNYVERQLRPLVEVKEEPQILE